MEMILTVVSGLVIICLLGAMLYATKVIKEKDDKKARGSHLKIMGLLLMAYAALNVLRMFLESKLG